MAPITRTLRARPAILLIALAAACNGGSSAPSAVTVAVTDMQAVFAIGDTVDLAAAVLDGNGLDLTATTMVTWTVTPAAAATSVTATTPGAGHASYQVAAEGTIQFQACAVLAGGAGSTPPCATVTIVASSTPLLTVTAPVPGAELGGSGMTAITVTGTVTSTLGARVFVNDVEATVDGTGGYSATVAPLFGPNHIVVVADDGVSAEARVELDVMWAADYGLAVTAAGAPGVAYDDALLLQLGQRFFDDGTTPPVPMTHPEKLPDLAQVLEVALGSIDLGTLLPNPLINDTTAGGDGITLSATSASLGPITVEIGVTDSGFDVFFRAAAVTVTTTGQAAFAGQMLSLDGTITAALSAYAPVTVSKGPNDTAVQVSVGTFAVDLESITSQLTDPNANALFAVAAGTLRTVFQQQLANTVNGLIATTIPSTLGGIFTSIDTALANKMIPINVSPLPMVTVLLDGHIGAIASVPDDLLLASLRVAAGTDATTLAHPKSRGVALTDAAGGTQAAADGLFDTPRLQLAVRLALLNGLLHSLWNSGLLELPSSSSLPANVSGKLPPIVRPPREGEAHDLVVSLGELELTPKGDSGVFGVSLSAGVDLTLTNGTLGFSIAATPDLVVWAITPAPEGSIYTPDTIRALILSLVWKSLQQAVAGSLSFKLPIPPLDGVAAIAPGLTGLTLAVGLDHAPAIRDGFVVLDVDWGATLP